MSNAESIHDQYLHLLNLPEALLRVLEEEKERGARRLTAPKEAPLDTTRLEQSPANSQKLINNAQLQTQTIRRKQPWAGEEQLTALRTAWRTEMKADEEVLRYLAAPAGPYADDQALLQHLYKTFVFKGEELPRYLEEGRFELGGKPLGGEKPGAQDGENARRGRRRKPGADGAVG